MNPPIIEMHDRNYILVVTEADELRLRERADPVKRYMEWCGVTLGYMPFLMRNGAGMDITDIAFKSEEDGMAYSLRWLV